MTLNRTSCETGCGVAVNATFTAGTATFSGAFCWNDATGCTTFTGLPASPAFATHRYTVGGKTYSPNVFVNDSSTGKITEAPATGATVYAHVTAAPIVASLWRGPTPANETFSGGAGANGLGPYTYSWALAFGNTSTAAPGSVPFQIYLRPGNYSVSVVVTDSLSYRNSYTSWFSVWGNSSITYNLYAQWNLVSLPYPSNSYTLFELGLILGGNALAAPFLSVQDIHGAASGGTTFSPGAGHTTGNTAAPPADALWIDLSAAKTITLFGNYQASAPSATYAVGWSAIGWSYGSTVFASGLASVMGAGAGLLDVALWDAASQSWKTFVYGWDAPAGVYDFPLNPGVAVYVYTTGSGTFAE